MKNITTLVIASLFFLGIAACEKVGKTEDSANNGKDTASAHSANDGHDHEGDADEVSDMPLTTVQWTETMHDFGKIPGTEKVTHIFKFKNTGNNPLKVVEVKPSCGCTKGKYSEENIAPGEEGFVELIFDPEGKTGLQTKSATVILNTDPKMHQLSFKADIPTK